MELQQAPVPKQPTGTPPAHHAPRQRCKTCIRRIAHTRRDPERAPGDTSLHEGLTACTFASIATGLVMVLKLRTLSAVPPFLVSAVPAWTGMYDLMYNDLIWNDWKVARW